MTGAPVPVLLVTGFLGTGKTTVVNAMLLEAGGRRIAAVVNDFGAVNIDAELVAGASDGVIDLSNGCICCSLQGDLLRTLAALLRRTPRPEAIVIETSGVADPAEIVRTLMDPVIWREAPLETVLCVVDAAAAGALDDALLRSQVRAADIVALSKTDLAGPGEAERARAGVLAIRPGCAVVEAVEGRVPLPLLFPDVRDATPAPREVGRARPAADRFETMAWTSDQLGRQPLDGRLEPRQGDGLVRAKGVFDSVQRRGRPLVFQLAGGRATLAPAGPHVGARPRVRRVFIAEIGACSTEEIGTVMEGCLGAPVKTGAAPG